MICTDCEQNLFCSKNPRGRMSPEPKKKLSESSESESQVARAARPSNIVLAQVFAFFLADFLSKRETDHSLSNLLFRYTLKSKLFHYPIAFLPVHLKGSIC